MTHTENSATTEAFSLERAHRFDQPAQYRDALATGAVKSVRLWNDGVAQLVTRYDQVREILGSQVFSAVPHKPGYPLVSPAFASLMTREKSNFVQMDDPDHLRFRRMVAPMFTIAKVERLRPRIEEIVAELYDRMEQQGAPFNFVDGFALVVPTLVVCEFVGVPYEDAPIIHEAAKGRMDLSVDPEVPLEAGRQFASYLDGLLRRRLEDEVQAPDLIGHLVDKQIKPGHLEIEDAVALIRVIMVAGHETTANAIGIGTLALLQHPEEAAKLREDPTLAASAVEEILRYTTIPHIAVLRAVTEDIEIGGHTLREGEGVIAALVAANRDPEMFADPERFDITRTQNHHLSFAAGIHGCLGQSVARLELGTVFGTLLQRFPSLRLAVPEDQLAFRTEMRAYGVWELPVEW